MLMTLPLLAALAVTPNQADALTLTDVRVTSGILGPTRQNTKYLPGDTLSLSFIINGITADPNGKVLYSIATEVTDAGGKAIFTQPAQDREAVNGLGGNQLPAFAQVAIGLQQPAGEHTLKVTVTDRANKKSQSLTQKFEVLPPGFGVVRSDRLDRSRGAGPGRSALRGAIVVDQRRRGQLPARRRQAAERVAGTERHGCRR